ncbi:MAG: hypothetical protein AAFX08_07865 [Pseudomonadota bacterium]
MDTVSSIPRPGRKVVDLREHQASLIAAEQAAWNALEALGNGTAAYVRFVREMNLSSADPRIRKILAELPAHIESAARNVAFVEECHRTAASLLASKDANSFQIDASYPKDSLLSADD